MLLYIKKKVGKWAQKTAVGHRPPFTESVQQIKAGGQLHYLTSDNVYYVNHYIICSNNIVLLLVILFSLLLCQYGSTIPY